ATKPYPDFEGGTRISSGQVNDTFDNLYEAVTTVEGRVTELSRQVGSKTRSVMLPGNVIASGDQPWSLNGYVYATDGFKDLVGQVPLDLPGGTTVTNFTCHF